MVKQGDIIKINFNPQAGYEQSGYRPALVISNSIINEKTNMTIVCPISNTPNKFKAFPLHIPLDNRTKTTGCILCQHIKSLDINARGYTVVENVPDDILKRVIATIIATIKE